MELEVKNNVLLFNGREEFNLNRFGINIDVFTKRLHALQTECGLIFLKNKYLSPERTSIWDKSKKSRVNTGVNEVIVDLIEKLGELAEMEYNIHPLIEAFHKAQKKIEIDEFYHTMAMMRICWHYFKSGFEVKIIPSGPSSYKKADLIIDGVPSEVKVRDNFDFDTRARKQ